MANMNITHEIIAWMKEALTDERFGGEIDLVPKGCFITYRYEPCEVAILHTPLIKDVRVMFHLFGDWDKIPEAYQNFNKVTLSLDEINTLEQAVLWLEQELIIVYKNA